MRRPEVFFDYYTHHLISRTAQPNAAHRALARLEEDGKLSAVITQNIDGLHQAAGSRSVIELHGSVWRNHCLACAKPYALDEAPPDARGIPRCPACGGIVRPDVVLYGEPLDDGALSAAAQALARADALIVGGTSLAVYPAASLLRYFTGDAIALINKTSTPYDGHARIVIRAPIGEALAGVPEKP